MMKNQAARAVAALAVVAVMVACLGQKARDSALIPAMRVAWPGVKADVTLGIEDAVAARVLLPEDGPVMAEVVTLDDGLREGDRTKILLVSWDNLSPYGERGIAARVTSGEISPGVSESLRERLKNFGEAFQKLSQESR